MSRVLQVLGEPDDAAHTAYPFDFRLEVDIRLTPRGLHQTALVTNTGHAAMPSTRSCRSVGGVMPTLKGLTREEAMRARIQLIWRTEVIAAILEPVEYLSPQR